MASIASQVKASTLNFKKYGIYTHSTTNAHSPESIKAILVVW